MSRFISAAATSQTLSLTAMEEASRSGERTAGVDHLFLALVVTEQTAGQVLRSIGITLPAAREAVAAQHDAQLASLGIRTEAPAPGRITFHETHGYEWGESALAVMRRSSEGGRRGDAAAVLRELLDEPSGFVEAVLQRLGTTPESVRTRLDEAEGLPLPGPREPLEPGALSGRCEGFAPADLSQVWEMLADPARMPEWEPGIGSVEHPPPQSAVGAQWTAHALRVRPDGSPLRVRPQHRTARVEITACEAGRLLEWSFTWPDAPKSNIRRVRVELEPAAAGTRLLVSAAWVRRRRPAPVRRLLLRPLYRYVMWIQVTQLSGSISRVFR